MYTGGIDGILDCIVIPVGPSWRTEFFMLPLIYITNTDDIQ